MHDGVLNTRRAGVLAHPTSLPGPGSSGTLGEDAYRFVDWCVAAGFSVWQVLPLGPCHGDRSPYQCQSVLAGIPALVDRHEALAGDWPAATMPEHHWLRAARTAFERGAEASLREAYEAFTEHHRAWLTDFALFRALKRAADGAPWWDWPAALRDRSAQGVACAAKTHAEAVLDECFGQFLFDRQWRNLRRFAHERGVALFGDAPIFVAEDSAEVWANREQFELNAEGRPERVAGVPPDYFSPTGQRWGNPLYGWDAMAGDGFAWWLQRLGVELERVDLLRIDHFRGLEAYWAIPAQEPTAMVGEWCHAPGAELLEAVRTRFGAIPVIAEDLGLITAEVEALRDSFGLPGMKVLHFAFGGDASNPYLPHNHVSNCVVYTGTHDNDTTAGWAATLEPHAAEHACHYLRCTRETLPSALMAAAYASVAALAVVPMQDCLGLDSAHRMNTPGTVTGNWGWRFQWSDVREELAAEMRALAQRYGRSA